MMKKTKQKQRNISKNRARKQQRNRLKRKAIAKHNRRINKKRLDPRLTKSLLTKQTVREKIDDEAAEKIMQETLLDHTDSHDKTNVNDVLQQHMNLLSDKPKEEE
jgi:hypothetical protein